MISIIIPVYNSEKTISRCLDSILSQSYLDWEAICIDDGSGDNSGSILDEFQNIDNRFKIVHTQNCGVSSARNRGLELAKGEWVTFADSDDWLEYTAFEEYLKAAKMYNSDVVRAGYIRHFDDGRTETIRFDDDATFTDVSSFFCSLERKEHYSWLWTMIIRRECIGDIRFDEKINYLEDHIFSYQCYFNCKRMAVVAKPTYNYCIHNSGSLSTCNDPYVLSEASKQEYILKSRMVAGKDKDMQRIVDDCYQYHLHSIVYLLYNNKFSYKERYSFSQLSREVFGFKYKEEKIFFSSLPFFLRNFLLIFFFSLFRK